MTEHDALAEDLGGPRPQGSRGHARPAARDGGSSPASGSAPPAEGDEARAEYAVEVFARLRSAEMTAGEKTALQARVADDQALQASIDAVSVLWSQLEALRDDPALVSMRRKARLPAGVGDAEVSPPGPQRACGKLNAPR